MRSRSAIWLALGLAVLLLGARALAQAPAAPPTTSAAPAAPPLELTNKGTIAERSALAAEDANQTVTATDLVVARGAPPPAGKPIVRVETVTVGRLWPSQERITSVKAGEPWSGEAARRAVREVLATGRFARAGVEVYPEGAGLVLRLALLPRRVIANITITGGVIDRADTLETAGLSEGGEVTATGIDTARARITALYAHRGFPKAIVRIDTADTDKADRAVVSIDIEPGPPLLIDRRVFFTDPVIRAEVGNLGARYKVNPSRNFFEEMLNGLGFDIGHIRADETILADADREMAEILKQNGFPRAEVRHKVVRKSDGVELQVRLASGPRLRPVFDGNRTFDADQLTLALDLTKGDVSKPAELEDRLRDFYVKRGFLDAEIKVTERGGKEDAVHYLSFRIVENRRVRVVKRIFPCLTGELSPDAVGAEIETFLEEDLPRADGFSAGDPRTLLKMFGPSPFAGNRPAPLDINPATTFAPASYERALKHLKDLFYSKGYMNAVLGPVQLMRARCDPKKSGEACVPEPLPRVPPSCKNDELGLPLPEPKLPESHRCEPNPQLHIECAPEVTVVMPIHLGPRSVLYDLAFDGNTRFTALKLADTAALRLGDPLSSLELEAARLRLVDFYQKEGYAYVDVRVAVEASSDRTRARARFVIAEHEIVIVTDFRVKGATRTDENLIKSRLALEKGKPYRQDLARTSEERIAALGTFTSVAISLEDPDVPKRDKVVLVTVTESRPQYLDTKLGFSTGEGFRFAFEFGHKNLGGRAIAVSLRVQLSYLPDVFILDDDVRRVYSAQPPINKDAPLDVILYRLERRIAGSLVFPDIGLGPTVGLSIDGGDLHDLQRDYGLSKESITPTLTWRPTRSVSAQGSLSAEWNEVQILSETGEKVARSFLRVPVGESIAFAQRVSGSFDGRNNPFAATSGILLAGGVEHVNAFPTDPDLASTNKSHFLKFTGKLTGYVPLGIEGFSVAMSLSGGYNFQLEEDSKTYPDRLFFLGGVDSIRSFSPESVVPQDIADCIVAVTDGPSCYTEVGGVGFGGLTRPPGARAERHVKRITIDDVVIRGGDLALNARVELRFPLPVSSILQGGLFLDAGNLWKDPATVDLLRFRFGLGLGLRIATPIGPIAFDYGFNLQRYSWEEVGAPNFSIGLF